MFAIIPSLLIAASAVSATVFPYNPEITYPTRGTVWIKGNNNRFGRVEWDRTKVPKNLIEYSDATTVRLWANSSYSVELARNFDLGDGRVSFRLPKSLHECGSCVVSLNDPSNTSPPFDLWDEDFS